VARVGQVFPRGKHPHIDRQIGNSRDLARPIRGDLKIDAHGGNVNVGGFVALAGRVKARQQEAAYQLG